jgi:hypothetical protein
MTNSEPVSADIAGSLAGIQAGIIDVTVAMTEVAGAIREDVHVELRRTHLTQIPIIAMLATLLVIGVMNFFTLRATYDTSDRARETSEIIYDCTHVGGDCNSRNANATNGAVNRIINSINAQGEVRNQELAARLQCIVRTNQDCPPTTTTTTPAGP